MVTLLLSILRLSPDFETYLKGSSLRKLYVQSVLHGICHHVIGHDPASFETKRPVEAALQ